LLSTITEAAGIITELNEANNTTILQNISLGFLKNNPVPDMESCNQGLGIELSIFQSMKSSESKS
jgi:hypothetical protein